MLGYARRANPTYLTVENAVGCRIMLFVEATMGPSRSLSARAEIQAGSYQPVLNYTPPRRPAIGMAVARELR
jgi:hypothetical protein